MLLQRRESARMSGQADASADVKFQVVEPPRVPVRPVAPRRSIFQSLVLLAATCAGVALAFLLSQGKPIYIRSSELQRDTGLPVLAVLSSIESADSKSGARSSRLRFAAAAAGLVVAYFVVALTAHSGSLALRRILGLGVS